MFFNRNFLFVFILTCLVYALLAAFSYRDVIFAFEMSKATSYSLIETGQMHLPEGRSVLMLLIGAALLYLYVQGFLQLKKHLLEPRLLIILAGILTAVVFFIVPFDSTDASVYINCGWLQTHYHVNPYQSNVSDIPNWFHDPMFKQHWIQGPSNYGPVFAAFCHVVVLLGGGNYIFTLFLFKAANAVCHLLITCLILFGLTRLQNGEQSIESAYLYAFNPFMLMQQVANAHNDIFMSFFVCLSVCLWLYRRYLLVFLSFFSGCAVKYVCLVMLPGLLFLMIKSCKTKKTVISLLLGLVPVAALSYFYLSGMDYNRFSILMSVLNQGQGSLRGIIGLWHLPTLDNLLGFSIGAACLVIMLRRLAGWMKQSDESLFPRQVINDMVLFVILLTCFYSPSCRAWYPALFFPLSLFLPPGSRVRQFSLLLTCLLTFSILWFGFPCGLNMPMFLFLAFVGSKLTAETNGLRV